MHTHHDHLQFISFDLHQIGFSWAIKAPRMAGGETDHWLSNPFQLIADPKWQNIYGLWFITIGPTALHPLIIFDQCSRATDHLGNRIFQLPKSSKCKYRGVKVHGCNNLKVPKTIEKGSNSFYVFSKGVHQRLDTSLPKVLKWIGRPLSWFFANDQHFVGLLDDRSRLIE